MENYCLISLTQKFQRGDMSVFPAIFAEFEKLLHFFASRLIDEDGFQELSVFFVELLYKIDVSQFKKNSEDCLSRYIAVCIRNKYISLSKRNDLEKSKNTAFFEGYLEKDRLFNEDLALTQALKELLYTLPPKQKRVILYKYIYNFSNKEIARHLSISPQAVNQIKNRALEKLRESYLGEF